MVLRQYIQVHLIRKELFEGNKITALDMCGFSANKPVIMVTGGSLGAENVNKLVRKALPEIVKETSRLLIYVARARLTKALKI